MAGSLAIGWLGQRYRMKWLLAWMYASRAVLIGLYLLLPPTPWLFYGFAAGLGFSLVLVLFAAMRERIAIADVPKSFQGAAIGMITAGLMSLAFMGFTGLIKL